MAWASASFLASNLAPSNSTSAALNRSDSAEEPAGLTVAAIFQYSSLTKARMSRSRSAISRTATDWTRPR